MHATPHKPKLEYNSKLQLVVVAIILRVKSIEYEIKPNIDG